MIWRFKVYNFIHKSIIYSLWGVSFVGVYAIYSNLKRLRVEKQSQLEQLQQEHVK